MAEPVQLGVIGCGNISGAYLKAAARFPLIKIAACSDLDLERAQKQAAEHGVPRACTVKDLIEDERIEIILNLTIPKAHAEVGLLALENGKHVHGEKPLAVERKEGRALLEKSKAKRLRVGSAPDTFLGGGHQTCRKLIDDGLIGRPVAATAFMMCPGHESWHPNPYFYYQPGGGPLFDMGPYYLTALVNLLGPVKRVSSITNISFEERVISNKIEDGKRIKVEVPTHVAGSLQFHSGAVATLIMSFDIRAHGLPCIEVYGSEGTLRVPDPNGFGGQVLLKTERKGEWVEQPLTHGYQENSRILGAVDMAYAIRNHRPHRCSVELAYHVLDVMHGLHESSDLGRHVEVESTCERPAPLPPGRPDGELDG
jgi:predicted dehydrogenase